MRTSTLMTTLALACTMTAGAAGGRADAAGNPAAPIETQGLTRNIAAFSPSTGTRCAELTAAYRQAQARLVRNALAVADAVEERDGDALERACRRSEKSSAELRDVLATLERRCPDEVGVVRAAFMEIPGDYAPAAMLLARCDD